MTEVAQGSAAAGPSDVGDVSRETLPISAPKPPMDFAGTKHKVKLEDIEEEIDYEELKSGYQKSKVSDKRFQEAARKEKLIQSLIHKAQEGDLSWLEDLVPEEKLREFSEKKLLKFIEFQNLSPEAQELHRERLEKEQLKKRLEEKEQGEKSRGEQEMIARAYQEIDVEIGEALAATGYGPKTGKKAPPVMIRRIAEQIRNSLELSDDDQAPRMSAAEALKRTQASLMQDVNEYLSELTGDEIRKLPKNVLDAIRKMHVDDAISQAPMKARNKALTASYETPPKKQKAKSTTEWFDKMNKKYG